MDCTFTTTVIVYYLHVWFSENGYVQSESLLMEGPVVRSESTVSFLLVGLTCFRITKSSFREREEIPGSPYSTCSLVQHSDMEDFHLPT